MSDALCTDCGAEALQALIEKQTFSHKGHLLSVDVDYSVCAQCGMETITQAQIKSNDCRTRAARRSIDPGIDE